MSSKKDLRRAIAVMTVIAFLGAPSTNAITPKPYDSKESYENDAFEQKVPTKSIGKYTSNKEKVRFHQKG